MNNHNDDPKTEQQQIAEYLKECVRIEPLALEEEFVRMPSDLAYWNERYARAVREHLTAKIEVDRVRANARQSWRQKLVLPENAHLLAGSKVTEALLESYISLDTRVQESERTEIDTEAKQLRLRGILEAIRTKRDMLISLGANMRAEMQNDPIIRNEHRDVRDAKKGQDR